MAVPRRKTLLTGVASWRIPRVLLVAYLILGFGGIGFFAWNFNAHVDDQYVRARTASTRLVDAYGRQQTAHGDFLSAIAAHLAAELAADSDARGSLVSSFTPINPMHLFTSAHPTGTDAPPTGRITGPLPIPKSGSPLAKEIDAAMELAPLCKAVLDRNPEMPWCYFVSVDRFVYLFPFSSDPTAYYTDEILRSDFFRLASPDADPRREQVWAPVHWDLAGKGNVTTIAQPVYTGDTFHGVVAIDIQMSTLLKIQAQYSLPGSTARLYSGTGAPMDAKSIPITPAAWRTITGGSSITIDGQRVIAQRIRASGWWLVTATDVRGAQFAALTAALPLSVIGLLVFISLALLVALTQAWREVRELAIRDGLTKLFNRRRFDSASAERLRRTARNSPRLGLAIMDVDNFKAYNDHYGHANGDAVLQAIARAISDSLRRADDMQFRIGGEEFAALIGVHDNAELKRSLERVRTAVQALGIEHAGTPAGVVTLSIGGTVVTPSKDIDVDVAYRTADAALYEAKETGRNRVVLRGA